MGFVCWFWDEYGEPISLSRQNDKELIACSWSLEAVLAFIFNWLLSPWTSSVFRGTCFHLQLTVVTWDFIGVQRGRYLHAVDQRAWKSVAGPRRLPGFMPLWVVGIQFVYDLRIYGRIGLSFNYYFKCNPIGFIWIGSDLNQIWLDCKISMFGDQIWSDVHPYKVTLASRYILKINLNILAYCP